MKNIDGLPKDEQLKKLKKENKTLLFSVIICTIVVVIISTIFFIFELDLTVAIGILFMLPFSWWIGYCIPKNENNKKIKEIESKDNNYTQLKDTALIEKKREKYSLIAGFICNLAIVICGSLAIGIITDGLKIEFAIVSGIIFVVIPFIIGIILYIISKTLK